MPFCPHIIIIESNLQRFFHTPILNDNRVNKINLKKEFFKISIDELEQLISSIDSSAEFNKTMLAEQYHQTLSLAEELSA